MSAPGSLSVVVPVYRDCAALQTLLAQLQGQRPPPNEIIVVDAPDVGDGGASAAEEAACAAGARYLTAAIGRGPQLRAGAAAAQGAVLWFLHADAILPANATTAILAAISRGARSGYFRFRFSGPRTWTKRLIEHGVRWRCRFGGVYGDQGLFARRDAYDASPGFTPQPLFEEVALVRALRRQGGLVALQEAIEVDCRRWEQRGYWRQTAMNRLLALGYALGLPPARLANWYRTRR